jgi:phage shock protein PspC (stress-responsive transcriptional regulator)
MKRLLLSTDKKISGVCGGIGDYYNLDPTLIRLGWIIMTVITGIVPGIIAYIVAAVIIPSEATKRNAS